MHSFAYMLACTACCGPTAGTVWQLLAHLHALSRRVRSSLQRQPSSQFTIGPIRFDASRNEVLANGKVEHLTPTESRILQILAVNVGDVCTQNQIVAHAWGYGEDGDTYLIKAHIRHLREKIEPIPGKPRYIRTVPGVGYTLNAGASPASTHDVVELASDEFSGHAGGSVDADESDDPEDTAGYERMREHANGMRVMTAP